MRIFTNHIHDLVARTELDVRENAPKVSFVVVIYKARIRGSCFRQVEIRNKVGSRVGCTDSGKEPR